MHIVNVRLFKEIFISELDAQFLSVNVIDVKNPMYA